MQSFYRICLICFLCLVSFLAGAGCFILFLLNSNYKIIPESVEYTVYEPKTENGFLQDAEEVAVKSNHVDMNTELVIKEINSVNGQEKTYSEDLPKGIVGCDREEVENYFTEYTEAPSLEDREKGFVKAALIEYSQDKILVEKIYHPLEKNTFYLKSEENYVVVYYSDLSTVYMYTDIVVDSLSEETKKELIEGKKIDSLDKLYSFLESSTS